MEYASIDYPISWFRNRYAEGSLEIRPPYQRKPVWVHRQKSKLIESILLDLPIPEIYLDETTSPDGTTTYAVVDGQQRIRTVLQFLGVMDGPQDAEFNNFPLEKLDATSQWKGKAFSDLRDEEKQSFFGYKLSARRLVNATDFEVRDMFRRLNAFLTKLNDQELRNAIYSGPFVSLVSTLADDSFWTDNKIVSPANIRRMKDVQFVSELLIGVIYGPQGGSGRDIDQHFQYFEDFEEEFTGQPEAVKRYRSTLKLVQDLLPDIKDHRWHNQADFYTLFVALAFLLRDREFVEGRLSTARKELLAFAAAVNRRLADERAKVSPDAKKYVRAVEKGVNDKARRTARHAVIVKLLTPFFRVTK